MENLLNNFIESFWQKFPFLLPEISITIGLNLLLLISLFEKKWQNKIWFASLLEGLYALILLVSMYLTYQMPQETFFPAFRQMILLSTLLVAIFFPKPAQIAQNKVLGEYYFLLLAASLGLMLMLKSQEWLSLLISLELSAVALYVLVVLSWQKNSLEGSLKYLLFGIMASAIMIYGISWLYGLQGRVLSFENIFWKISNSQLTYVAFILVLSGFLLKISAFPWHIWTPDAYQIAPTSVTAFLATAPKIASTAVLYKISLAYEPVLPVLPQVFFLIAVASILVGNLVAFWQKNLKRMLAYSSVANAGFLLIATNLYKSNDEKIFLFFLLVYVLANFLLFALAEHYETKHQIIEIQAFEGLGQKDTFLMIAMFVGFLTLAGLPPTAGFTAKMLLFSLLWEKYQSSQESFLLIWLVIGLLATFLALFYYLKIPFLAFFRPSKNFQRQKNLRLYLLVSLLLLLLLLLFFRPFLLFK
ncbi:NADH-quinone oxidoreductase subunit N [Raineya orbicola]|uniref:NADH-quinone oxidoreductase subunit N n=1 Tax=Raineya orbicola TaxID=2016530 RepID=A0A2N3I9S5_9BACT|nr:NADH-quinone oxidoreductase subunit N [Raineya orbicola]PKQ67059.1 NADH:ubiquinone oxidoreductase subunit 2 (chain N) [Raineya orbicola]